MTVRKFKRRVRLKAAVRDVEVLLVTPAELFPRARGARLSREAPGHPHGDAIAGNYESAREVFRDLGRIGNRFRGCGEELGRTGIGVFQQELG
jgi:hypothetical protein